MSPTWQIPTTKNHDAKLERLGVFTRANRFTEPFLQLLATLVGKNTVRNLDLERLNLLKVVLLARKMGPWRVL